MENVRPLAGPAPFQKHCSPLFLCPVKNAHLIKDEISGAEKSPVNDSLRIYLMSLDAHCGRKLLEDGSGRKRGMVGMKRGKKIVHD